MNDDELMWVDERVDTAAAREGASLAFAAAVNGLGHAISAVFSALCYGAALAAFWLGNGILSVRAHVMNEQAGKDGPPPRWAAAGLASRETRGGV